MSIPNGVALMLELEADVRRSTPNEKPKEVKINPPLEHIDIYKYLLHDWGHTASMAIIETLIRNSLEVRKK